jgi:hypothetical protein
MSLAAMLLVRASAANAIALAQTIKYASAVRLASEFSAWTHRDGHQALGMPLDEAFAESSAHPPDCDEGNCSAEQGAWHYLFRWRERMSLDVPDVRVELCIDDELSVLSTGWTCDRQGNSWVMKIGWPPRSEAVPTIVIALGAA